MYQKYFKRFFDIIFSFILIISLFPVIILLFFLVRIFIGSPIIFNQSRAGLNGHIFDMYKFRTMINESYKNGVLLQDKDRLTCFGQFLRSFSLDELPALWNVLKGDMSLVGPRPLLAEYLPFYSETQSRRHEVRPGITGWAQINGRNAISWNKKFELDLWYLDNLTLKLDIKIFCLTLKKTLARNDISPKHQVIMPRFDSMVNKQKNSNKIRIAVISDIHSNFDTLTSTLSKLKNKSISITIFLGDILTYGSQPKEVLYLLKDYKEKNHAIFIKGNHEQLYFDLQSGIKNSTYKPPKFVYESVNWTLEKISPFLLKDIFLWHDNYRIGNVYFSHANPFLYGDWSYIEKPKNLYKAFQELHKKKVFAGVFGHSHRQLFIGIKKNTLYRMNSYSATANNIDQLIINAGSIGQPRGKGQGYILLDIINSKLFKASFKKLN